MSNFQLRGDINNPYHLSVGGVLLDNSQVFLIKKPDGILTLPRETAYSNESFTDVVIRGFKDEIGIVVDVEKYIGSLIIHFNRLDNSEIEKTTLYFLVKQTGICNKSQAEDELNDEIISIDVQKAIQEFITQDNDEYKIIQRALEIYSNS